MSRLLLLLPLLVAASLWGDAIPLMLDDARDAMEIQTYQNYTTTEDVDVVQRGEDFKEAFDALQEVAGRDHIYIIAQGISIDRVTSFELMSNGTLVMVTYSYGGGDERQVVRVEDIQEIGIR